jgi:hypothetical protein
MLRQSEFGSREQAFFFYRNFQVYSWGGQKPRACYLKTTIMNFAERFLVLTKTSPTGSVRPGGRQTDLDRHGHVR